MNYTSFLLEWSGAITALIGSALMATSHVNTMGLKSVFKKYQSSFAYAFWIISNFLCIILFVEQEKYGLLVMNVGGLFVNFLGFYQWFNPNSKHRGISIGLITTSFLLLLTSLFFLFSYFFSLEIKDAEWFGSLLGLVAAFLLASKTNKSYLCWFVWSVSNITLLIITLYYSMYGMAFLQSGFMLINITGCVKWLQQLKHKDFDSLTTL